MSEENTQGTCAAVLGGVPADAPRVLVRGCANSGKTRAALDRVTALVECDADPREVLLVVASATAAVDARAALVARGAWGAQVRVVTAPEVELGLLADPAAYALTGRRPRVLTEFEWQMVMEDMRAESIPTKNLKGMIGFFQRSWTELADDDMESFIIDPRERMALDALKGYLGAYEAMLASEVANLAVNYLRACPDAGRACGARHVVLDGYQSLSRASQMLFELLEPATLWAFADPCDAARGADPFPYLKGVAEFEERNPGCTVVDLPAPQGDDAAAAAWTLAETGYVEALSPGLVESRGRAAIKETYGAGRAPSPQPGVQTLVAKTPAQELAAVAQRVADLLEQSVAPAQVLVCVPNGNWMRGVAKHLEKRGVACQTLGARQPVGGDLRNLESCGTARMYTALALLADPTDPLAWRLWCGFGDYVGRSTVFKQLVPAAREAGVSLDRALAMLARDELDPALGKSVVGTVYAQGQEMVGTLQGLCGRALLRELAAGLGLDGVPAVFARACDAAGEQAGAAELFAAAQRLVLAPALAGDEAGVRVVDYSRATGIKTEHAVVAGCMNGWLPAHAYFDAAEAFYTERQRMDREGRHVMYNLAGRASRDVLFTSFTTCDLELAERLKLKGYRVSMTPDGDRVTTVRPSVLLDYALDAWGLEQLADQAVRES